jgi:Zn-dependent alcohol dehydrogenase
MEEIFVRRPQEEELRVDMVASGICYTDALIGRIPGGAAPIAFYSRVLGHAGSAYVREVGLGVTVAKPRDPVLLSFAFCDKCATSKDGHHSHCPDFTELNFCDVCRCFGLKSKEGDTNI